jgi:hypothetical protein
MAGFVPSIIETVERTMESLRLHEGLKSDDEALVALQRKVALELAELEISEPRFRVYEGGRTEGGRTRICRWPDNSACA